MTRSVSVDRECQNRFILAIQRMAEKCSENERVDLITAFATTKALLVCDTPQESDPADVRPVREDSQLGER